MGLGECLIDSIASLMVVVMMVSTRNGDIILKLLSIQSIRMATREQDFTQRQQEVKHLMMDYR